MVLERFGEGLGRILAGLGKDFGQFGGFGMRVFTKVPLAFLHVSSLGFWGYKQEIAAAKKESKILSLQRPTSHKNKMVCFSFFVAAISLWLSFLGTLNMARRNARSDEIRRPPLAV